MSFLQRIRNLFGNNATEENKENKPPRKKSFISRKHKQHGKSKDRHTNHPQQGQQQQPQAQQQQAGVSPSTPSTPASSSASSGSAASSGSSSGPSAVAVPVTQESKDKQGDGKKLPPARSPVKEDNTEFEQIAAPARPAAVKNSTIEGVNAMEQMQRRRERKLRRLQKNQLVNDDDELSAKEATKNFLVDVSLDENPEGPTKTLDDTEGAGAVPLASTESKTTPSEKPAEKEKTADKEKTAEKGGEKPEKKEAPALPPPVSCYLPMGAEPSK